MTKKDQIELLRRGARTGLTALLFAAVAGVGLFVAGITWTGDVDWSAAVSGDYAGNYPPVPGDSQQSMTPNGRPIGGASDHLILPLIIKTDNSNKRFSITDRALFHTRQRAGEVDDLAGPCTSTAAVDSRLGRQFTLVGAKPSGTG